MREALLFRRMTVIGVGLIGGSLGLRCRQEGCVGEVIGVGRGRENLEVALSRGAIDRHTHDPVEGVEGADLVVFAVPVGGLVSLAERVAPALGAEAIVTDVGSVKGKLVEEMELRMPPGVCFVGGHPIAGSHRTGAAAADPHLFEGKRCILTPTGRTPPEAVERVRRLWTAVGAAVEEMDPHLHDAILAAVSHLPQVVATCLVRAVAHLRFNGTPCLAYAGSGFADTTRIAASDPMMWRDVWRYNAGPLREVLRAFVGECLRVEHLLDSQDWAGSEQYLSDAQKERRRLDIPG